MKNLQRQIEKLIWEDRKILHDIDRFCQNAPEGSLRLTKCREGKARYYRKYVEKATGQVKRKYLSKKKDAPLIRQLAQKQYLCRLRPVIEQELTQLEKLYAVCADAKKEEVYSRLSKERKKLIEPVFISPEEAFCRWKQEEYESFLEYPEALKFETDRGEFVRSKSELIIANLLYQKRDMLHYRYEAPLELRESGITVHPDFTIMKRSTGQILYWEHAGRMDHGRYADDFVRKVNAYIREGICPGESLLISYETGTVPLDIHVARKMVEGLLVT